MPRFLHLLLLTTAATTMTAVTTLAKSTARNRDEIPAQYRWDFSPIYPSWEAWEAGMKEMEAKMDAFAALKGSLAQGPAAVLKAYRLFDEIGMAQYKAYRYPQLQRDVDTRNQAIAGRFQRVGAMVLRYSYLLRSSHLRILDMVYWPAVQLLTWGFLQTYLLRAGALNAPGGGAQAASTLIGAILLWDILLRGQQGFRSEEHTSESSH